MVKFVNKFWKEEEGVTAIEYGLIAALLSVMIIGGLTVASPALKDIFDSIGDALKAAQTE